MKEEIKELTIAEVADLLHCCGLHGYVHYEEMGRSGEMWNNFRLKLADEILHRVKVSYRTLPASS